MLLLDRVQVLLCSFLQFCGSVGFTSKGHVPHSVLGMEDAAMNKTQALFLHGAHNTHINNMGETQ